MTYEDVDAKIRIGIMMNRLRGHNKSLLGMFMLAEAISFLFKLKMARKEAKEALFELLNHEFDEIRAIALSSLQWGIKAGSLTDEEIQRVDFFSWFEPNLPIVQMARKRQEQQKVAIVA